MFYMGMPVHAVHFIVYLDLAAAFFIEEDIKIHGNCTL